MKKNFSISVLIIVTFFASQDVWCAPKKLADLMAVPEFAKADSEGRLEFVNTKITNKEFGVSDVSIDITARLIMDVLIKEKTPTEQLQRYGQIRAKYTKLNSTYDIENYLAVQYLATDPEAVKADLLGKIKLLHKLNKEKILSWPGVAPLLQGMLAYYLATNQEYQQKSPMEKIAYLSSLEGLQIVGNMTSTIFSKGVASELMSNTPSEKQPETLKTIEKNADFFTKTATKNGYGN